MEEKQEELEIYQEEDLPQKYSEAECLQMNFKEIKKVRPLLSKNSKAFLLKLNIFKEKIKYFKCLKLSSFKLQKYHKLIEELADIQTQFNPIDFTSDAKIKYISERIASAERILKKNKFVLDEFIKTHAKQIKNQFIQSRKRKRKNKNKAKKNNK